MVIQFYITDIIFQINLWIKKHMNTMLENVI